MLEICLARLALHETLPIFNTLFFPPKLLLMLLLRHGYILLSNFIPPMANRALNIVKEYLHVKILSKRMTGILIYASIN